MSALASDVAWNPSEPFAAWAGSRAPRMLLVGEAWGSSEDAHHAPFVGHSGKELIRMLGDAGVGEGATFGKLKRSLFAGDEYFLALREAWLREAGVALVHAWNVRPQSGKLEDLCDAGGKGLVFRGRALPPLVKSPKHAYMAERYVGQLVRLGAEVKDACGAAVVVALGPGALWALRAAALSGAGQADTSTHTDLRGTVLPGPPRLLPSHSPGGILRQWNNRSVLVADLMKAWRESARREFVRPRRRVAINLELDDIREWSTTYLPGAPWLSVDIETRAGQITSVGFATARDEAMVVQLVEVGETTFRSYWRDAEDERQARVCIRELLRSAVPKVLQNGLYDLQWLLRERFPVRNVAEDTMLQHFAIHPEMRKGLGFLGSIYTDEPAWKIMRDRGKDVVEKKDE